MRNYAAPNRSKKKKMNGLGIGNYAIGDTQPSDICAAPLDSYVDPKLEAFIFPDNPDYPAINDCIFNYPDVSEPDMIIISADGKEGCGDDQYGNTSAIECPITL
eukprot:279941_1